MYIMHNYLDVEFIFGYVINISAIDAELSINIWYQAVKGLVL